MIATGGIGGPDRLIETAAIKGLRASAQHERVFAVVASAGWGKTTAARAAFPDALYVPVPPGNRVGAFHRALLTAFGVSADDTGRIVAALSDDQEAVNRSIVRAAPPGETLILDDVHRLDPESASLVEALIDTSDLRILLVGRSLGRLPVGSWISRGTIGVPFDRAVLCLTPEHVEALVGASAGVQANLATSLVSAIGGWPVAASLACSLVRRGRPQEQIVLELKRGLAWIAESMLAELPRDGQTEIVEAALLTVYGAPLTNRHRKAIEGLGLPESATGLHEVVVPALLKCVDDERRASVASALAADVVSASIRFSMLAHEAPEQLADHAWSILVGLERDSDAHSMVQFTKHTMVPRLAIRAARCFVLAQAGSYPDAAAGAEAIIEEVAQYSAAVTVRLSRVIYVGRGSMMSLVPLLQAIESDDPYVVTNRDCLLGHLLQQPAYFARAATFAAAADDQSIAVYVATAAAQAAMLRKDPETDALAARAADLAEAAGSITHHYAALQVRFNLAFSRLDWNTSGTYAQKLLDFRERLVDGGLRRLVVVSAFDVAVTTGRYEQAEAYLAILKREGDSWVGSDIVACGSGVLDVCRGRVEGVVDRLVLYADSLAAFVDRHESPVGFPTENEALGLAAFLASTKNATARALELLRRHDSAPKTARTWYTIESKERARAYAGMAEVMLGRSMQAAKRLVIEAQTPLGCVFVEAARRFQATGDVEACAEVLGRAGLQGPTTMVGSCAQKVIRKALSSTELSVLTHFAAGMDTSAIAILTGRSKNTIRNQRQAILHKLGAANLYEAIAIARRQGLLPD